MPEYTLRQTTPEQVMTHWSTCYTHHSACMERKVDQMTGQIQAMQVDGSAYAMGYQRADDAARAVIEGLRAENVALKAQLRALEEMGKTLEEIGRRMEESGR